MIVGFPENSRSIHDEMWKIAGRDGFAYRRVFDLRLALTLQAFGVKEFATCNGKDFEGIGFARVWNPLMEA